MILLFGRVVRGGRYPVSTALAIASLAMITLVILLALLGLFGL